MNHIKILVSLFILSFFSCSAQEKTNLQIYSALVDSSASELTSFLPDSVKKISIEMNTGTSFQVFNSEIISFLTNKEYTLSPNAPFRLQYYIKNASVNYGDIYRDGILGDYFVPRLITLSGNFNLYGKSFITQDFEFSKKDTVNLDSVRTIENPAYPFTQGKLPPEPFFSGLLEPIVAVGTTALAVILFFTIRSK